jgi:LysM repeat protein
MSFVRKSITNGAFRKVTSSTAFGGGGSNMLSLTSSVNSGSTSASINGTSGNLPSGGSGTGGGGGGSGDGCAEIEMLMSSAVVTDISEISKNYASGAFDIIKSQLNQTLYNNYSLGLYTARKPLNATYEKVRKFINTNLEGLLQSINLYNTNTNVTAQRDAYQIIADKFNDPNELLAQLNMLRRSISLFPDQHITVIPVEIKPEYLAYIKTYGYPENGIWDPDLLGAILASIGPASNV